MNRFCLICKFLSVLFLISNESRTQARQMADSLMKGHEYALAAVYYEKALFDQNQQVDTVISENFRLLTNTLLNQKIQCQKALRTFEDAWQTAQRFDLNEPNDTLQFKLRYEGALCGYLSQRYNEAYGQIQQTRFYTRDTTLTASLDVLEILTLNELERWTESKVIFARYVSRNRLTIQVDKLYDFLKKKPKNPDKAQLLSFLMPGLGQIYAGYPKEGLISAGLQALSLGFGAYHVLNHYYWISFFSGASLFQALYFGGARRASIMTGETNQKRKVQNNQKIRAILVENEQKKAK